MLSFKKRYALMCALPMICMCMSTLSGCDRKETILDIETPAGDIEVEKSHNTGDVDVKIESDRKSP